MLGCVYNGDNPSPYALPDEKTKSTIKTQSSLGGGGSNELRFRTSPEATNLPACAEATRRGRRERPQ
ncbi:MAG: hypothetical protein R3B82_09085 [Sandaracinaceae bacterium]